jgi:hypothetical protein
MRPNPRWGTAQSSCTARENSTPTTGWAAPAASGPTRHGRHRHSTLSLTAIGCHCVGTDTVVLLPLLSFSVEMTVPPVARPDSHWGQFALLALFGGASKGGGGATAPL